VPATEVEMGSLRLINFVVVFVAVAITKHATKLSISLPSSPLDSNPPPLDSQMHDEASTPLHDVNLRWQLDSPTSPEIPDRHRPSYYPSTLISFPTVFLPIEIVVDDFTMAFLFLLCHLLEIIDQRKNPTKRKQLKEILE